MKNKRLIIILSVFAFLVLIAVLCSAVFTVKKVSLNWLTTKVIITDPDETFTTDVEKGESVFLVDKEAIINKLENKYPYLKVVSVEVKFPNKLVIHTAERQELYSLKIRDDKHAILDADCKVLRFASDSELNKIDVKPIPLTLVGYSISEENLAISQIANLGWVKNVLANFSIALYSSGYHEIDAKNNIESISVDVSGYENKILVNMDYQDISGEGGVQIEIEQVSEKLIEKFMFAVELYDNTLTEQQRTEGKIKVYLSNGVVDGYYEPPQNNE